jgi:ElaB/YqjD/DUF883 family membrane-anchored ribosome-binding protein
MPIPPDIEDERNRVIEEGARSAVEFVSDRPLTVVGIAAAFGFVIGFFVL